MIDKKETKKLLERFYCGLTDETEEKHLAEYFCSNEVDEELREEAKIFLADCNKTLPSKFHLI